MQVFEPSDEVHRTCRDYELQQLTEWGWRLVMVYQENRHETVMEDVPAYQRANYNYMQTRQKYVPCTTTMFVLAKRESVLISEMENAVASASALKQEADKRANEATQALEEMKKKLQLSQDAEKIYVSRLENERKQHDAQRTVAGNLEHDIAKLRKAIGELKFREILEQKA